MINVRRYSILGFALGACVFLASACGGDDEESVNPSVKLCDRVANTACAKIYSCTNAEQRRAIGLLLSEAECVVGVAQQAQCDKATPDKVCAGTAPYPTAEAQKCITEANQATCAQIVSNGTNVRAYAPSCGQCAPTL